MRLSKTSLVFLPAVSALSEHAVGCVNQQADKLSTLSNCGDVAAIRECFISLTEGSIQSDIEQCLLAAGCGADEAALDALAITYLCEDSASWAKTNELRKRQRTGGNNNNNNNAADDEEDANDTTNNSNDEEDAADEETDSKANTKTANAKATTTAAAPAQTVEDKAVGSTEAATTTASVSRVTAAAAQTVSNLSKASQGTECYQTSTATESICDPTGNCEQRAVEKVKCLSGYLCRMDSKGTTTCMEKVNTLDTGGIIVSIIFAAAIVLSIGMMTFFCCRDRAQQKKLNAKAEAAAIAKASSAGTRARNVSDRQPLMTSQPENTQGYGPEGGAPQPDPFNDQNRY
ncbi:hypothetical protein jhhlp_006772 [Lomentospora prolificans]|uniref:Extracellular membrane protein CFEM domain-containing protein n=1 Tax=Lomentospora prolificans TaxID=41688 RepID=A0A2N3N2P7_9PEZI|nr:hypothetical protein jhhlp_006772 [Lomentospora prolificans]